MIAFYSDRLGFLPVFREWRCSLIISGQLRRESHPADHLLTRVICDFGPVNGVLDNLRCL